MRKPHILLINVTTKCNFNCRYCFGPKKESKKDPTLKQIEKIIDGELKKGIRTVIFSGGEPLLRKDISEMISYAKEKGLYTILHTNGFLLTKAFVKKVEADLDQLNIPLDGFDEISNDSQRVAGHFNKVMNIFWMMKGIDIKLVVSTVAHKGNREFISKIADLIPSYAHKWRILQFKKTKQTEKVAKTMELTKRDFESIKEKITKKPMSFEIDFIENTDKSFYQSYKEI